MSSEELISEVVEMVEDPFWTVTEILPEHVVALVSEVRRLRDENLDLRFALGPL